MRLAYWYPASTFSAWSISLGAVDALRGMGHEVLDCGIDPTATSFSRAAYPSAGQLESLDGVIISGPEHLGRFLLAFYPEWEQLKVPKAAWLHETVCREDYGQLDVALINRLAKTVFCPAVQDERYGFHFLPFGVDMQVFRPEPNVPRDIDVGFIGLVYPKRRVYLDRIKAHLGSIELRIGHVEVRENGRVNPRKTVLAYAAELRRMKVFLNLPTLSQLLVTKIYEVAAAGACMLTPILKGEGRRNHAFVGNSIRIYDEDNPAQIAPLIKTLLEERGQRECWSRQASEEMYGKHRIELRLQKILDALKG